MSLQKFITTGLIAFLGLSTQLLASSCHDHGGSHQHKKAETTSNFKGTQKVCPIMKNPIDEEAYVESQGQKVYFCCPGCDKKFLKDPEKYFSEMKTRGEVSENIQTVCPVSGEDLDENKVSLTLPGRKVFFCCKKCSRSFKKDPAKYTVNLESKTTIKVDAKHDHADHGQKNHDHGAHHH
jgi:YHS domain-containing protein